MPLTKDFKDTIKARAERDHEFRAGLFREAIEAMFSDDLETGKVLLRDYVNATVGFETLAKDMQKDPKSLMRMLSAKGNPRADNLLAMVSRLKQREGMSLSLTGGDELQALIFLAGLCEISPRNLLRELKSFYERAKPDIRCNLGGWPLSGEAVGKLEIKLTLKKTILVLSAGIGHIRISFVKTLLARTAFPQISQEVSFHTASGQTELVQPRLMLTQKLLACAAYFAELVIQTGRSWLIAKALPHRAKAMQWNVLLQINYDISDETVPIPASVH